MRRTIACIAAAVGLLAGAAACSGDDDDPPAGGPSTPPTTDAGAGVEAAAVLGAAAGERSGRPGEDPSVSASGTATTEGAGCTDAPSGAPAVGEANVGLVGDVDGDGRDDQAWVVAGPGEFGIATAAGGVAAATSSLASPTLAVLVADADGQGPIEVYVSDGSTAELWAYTACALEPVIGPDGAPWLFDLGERGNGTGSGCVEVDGVPHLVGLNVESDDGTTVTWKRTIIELDGLTATIGASDTGTFTRPDDAAQIDLLHTVSCHDLTITDDGITSG